MPTPEDIVKKEVASVLSGMQARGDILWQTRLQCGKVKNEFTGSWIQLCEKGTPDFVCCFQDKNKQLVLMFIECKRPDVKPELNENQERFFKTYKGIHPSLKVIVVQSGKEASKAIIELVYNRMLDIDLF